MCYQRKKCKWISECLKRKKYKKKTKWDAITQDIKGIVKHCFHGAGLQELGEKTGKANNR